MAARKNKVKLTDTWKERIRTSMLLNRLNNHALGDEEMTSTQIDAAKFLLNKVISNAPTQTKQEIDTTTKSVPKVDPNMLRGLTENELQTLEKLLSKLGDGNG